MSTASVLYKLRRLLGDMPEGFNTQLPGDGLTTHMELDVDVLDENTLTVMLIQSGQNSIVWNQGTDYLVDSHNGVLELTAPVPIGWILSVSGIAFQDFTDADLLDYLAVAFYEHTIGRNPPIYLDPVSGARPPTLVLPLVEERAVALLAARDVLQDQATAAAPEITIDTGDGTVIPRSQRFQQLTAQAAQLYQQYQDLTEKLGIQSPNTVSTIPLRRVSRTTNRLVPLYVPREWDDRRFVQRVMAPIDTGLASVGQVVTYRGEWSIAASYSVSDEVDWLSARYLAVAPSTGVNPATDVAAGSDGVNGSYWQQTTINAGMAGYPGGW